MPIIDFIRTLLGNPPSLGSLLEIGNLLEYIFAGVVFLIVIIASYALIGNIISIFRR